MAAKHYWVYILYCANESYYTGYTIDLEKRYRAHLSATGHCKYTRSFKPIKIAQCWRVYGDRAVAMQIERHIKKLTRLEKEIVIANPSLLVPIFEPYCQLEKNSIDSFL